MEAEKVKELSPGCFGSPSVYGSDSNLCKKCVVFSECGEASLKTLEAIKASIDVRDLLARHSRTRAAVTLKAPEQVKPIGISPVPVSQPQPVGQVKRKTPVERVSFHIPEFDAKALEAIEKQNSKAGKAAYIFCKNGKIQECRELLPQKLNPFVNSGPQYMRVAIDCLLEGGFTKASLKQRIMQELSWSDSSAGPHVSIAILVLYSFGIVKIEGANVVLHPDLTVQSSV